LRRVGVMLWRQIKKVRLAYFKTFWNILDIVVILIAVCCVIFSIYRTSEVNDKLDSLLSKPDDYSDFNSLAYWQITFNSAIAIMVFICWVKVSIKGYKGAVLNASRLQALGLDTVEHRRL